MTNGEKIKQVFPDVKWWVNEDNEVFTDHNEPNKKRRIAFDADWWNAEYQESKQNIFDYLTATGQGMIEGEKIADAEWKQAIKDIKAEIEAKNTSIEDFADTHGWVNGLTNEHNAHEADLAIITKHTKELMK